VGGWVVHNCLDAECFMWGSDSIRERIEVGGGRWPYTDHIGNNLESPPPLQVMPPVDMSEWQPLAGGSGAIENW